MSRATPLVQRINYSTIAIDRCVREMYVATIVAFEEY